jgi:hypothetical protein
MQSTVGRVSEHEAEVLKAEIVARDELAGGVTRASCNASAL